MSWFGMTCKLFPAQLRIHIQGNWKPDTRPPPSPIHSFHLIKPINKLFSLKWWLSSVHAWPNAVNIRIVRDMQLSQPKWLQVSGLIYFTKWGKHEQSFTDTSSRWSHCPYQKHFNPSTQITIAKFCNLNEQWLSRTKEDRCSFTSAFASEATFLVFFEVVDDELKHRKNELLVKYSLSKCS